MSPPIRIRLSRARGWRMPPNTVKVDRSTKYGNPCVVGVHGTRDQCVTWFRYALAGAFVLGYKNPDGTWLTNSLRAYNNMLHQNLRYLRGKNLACWCPLDAPCHADVLLEAANPDLGFCNQPIERSPPDPSEIRSFSHGAHGLTSAEGGRARARHGECLGALGGRRTADASGVLRARADQDAAAGRVKPADIKSARIAAGMTQTEAGACVGGSLRTWQDWESGKRAMPVAAWELFLLHTDQHPTHRLVEKSAR